MADDFDVAKADRTFAARFFNDTWDSLDKAVRTEAETEAMLHCCHASFHHWTRVADATPTNRAIGYWQLSRVYAVAGMPAEAERYARRCEESAQAPGAEAWVMGSAHEALARCASLRGDRAARDAHLAAARAVAAAQADKETRDILTRDIESVP
jgi:hypothetical protein